MARARTGSHSRTEPGAVHAYEVVDHGVDRADYFQGCGIAHTQWDDVAVGADSSSLGAYEDAVEALAQGGWDVDTLPKRPRGLSRDQGTRSESSEGLEWEPLQHFVCVYVRGNATRRTQVASQRRAGTVGPGRPGQQFTHGDVEIETTLHPIDLDGGFRHPPGSLGPADEDDLERYELVYGTGGHGGPVLGLDRAKAQAERMIASEPWIALVPYRFARPYTWAHATWVLNRDSGWERGPVAEHEDLNKYGRSRFDGLGAVSPRTRLGTRVTFAPNPASRMLYSSNYGLPEVGEEGTVTYMPGFKPKTYFPGPGGGLLYVEWDQAGVLGVSPNDVVKAGAADPYQQYRRGR